MSDHKTGYRRLAVICPITVVCVALEFCLFSLSGALIFGRLPVAAAAVFSLAFMCMPTVMTGVINSIAFHGARRLKVLNCAISGGVVTAAAAILFFTAAGTLPRSALAITWLWYLGGQICLLLFYLTGFIGQKLKQSAPPQYVMRD